MKLLNQTLQNIIIASALSGMRTNAGLLITAILVRRRPINYFSQSPLVKIFYNKKATTILAISGVAELVIDKLPTTPARINGPGLSARIAAGAFCGATLSIADGKKPLQGVIAGSFAAIAATYTFYYLRKSLAETTSIPNPVTGAAEDALTIAGGIAILKKN